MDHKPKKRTRMPNWDKFENDAVLPAQWHAGRTSQPSGEWRLYEAVLEDAIDVLKLRARVGLDHRARRLLEDTLHWVRSDATSWPLDFTNLCDVLGLTVSATRKALLAGTMQRLRRPGVLVKSAGIVVHTQALSYGDKAGAYAPSYVAPATA